MSNALTHSLCLGFGFVKDAQSSAPDVDCIKSYFKIKVGALEFRLSHVSNSSPDNYLPECRLHNAFVEKSSAHHLAASFP
jgi:hypothetical protein